MVVKLAKVEKEKTKYPIKATVSRESQVFEQASKVKDQLF